MLAVTGNINKSPRALMTGLLGELYNMGPASYDLTRLRRNGLFVRVEGRNLYRLTADGLAFATFYTKVHNRVLRPPMATDQPRVPPRRPRHPRTECRRPPRTSPAALGGRLKLWTSAEALAAKDR
jgi:hypothetical protein